MKFTKYEQAYNCVFDYNHSTASMINDFMAFVKAHNEPRSCKEWATLYFGEDKMHTYLKDSYIASVSTMFQKASNSVRITKVETEPYIKEITYCVFQSLKTGELIPEVIKTFDEEGNVYYIDNPRMSEYCHKYFKTVDKFTVKKEIKKYMNKYSLR